MKGIDGVLPYLANNFLSFAHFLLIVLSCRKGKEQKQMLTIDVLRFFLQLLFAECTHTNTNANNDDNFFCPEGLKRKYNKITYRTKYSNVVDTGFFYWQSVEKVNAHKHSGIKRNVCSATGCLILKTKIEYSFR